MRGGPAPIWSNAIVVPSADWIFSMCVSLAGRLRSRSADVTIEGRTRTLRPASRNMHTWAGEDAAGLAGWTGPHPHVAGRHPGQPVMAATLPVRAGAVADEPPELRTERAEAGEAD